MPDHRRRLSPTNPVERSCEFPQLDLKLNSFVASLFLVDCNFNRCKFVYLIVRVVKIPPTKYHKRIEVTKAFFRDRVKREKRGNSREQLVCRNPARVGRTGE